MQSGSSTRWAIYMLGQTHYFLAPNNSSSFKLNVFWMSWSGDGSLGQAQLSLVEPGPNPYDKYKLLSYVIDLEGPSSLLLQINWVRLNPICIWLLMHSLFSEFVNRGTNVEVQVNSPCQTTPQRSWIWKIYVNLNASWYQFQFLPHRSILHPGSTFHLRTFG